jgi:hypothetical protein
MKLTSPGRAVLFGFFVWLIPFVVSVAIYPIHETARPLFESIMPVVGGLSAVVFLALYVRRLAGDYRAEGVALGALWFAISLGLDLLLFMWGPMKMTFLDYMMDIGVVYLLLPIITIGVGAMLDGVAARAAT